VPRGCVRLCSVLFFQNESPSRQPLVVNTCIYIVRGHLGARDQLLSIQSFSFEVLGLSNVFGFPARALRASRFLCLFTIIYALFRRGCPGCNRFTDLAAAVFWPSTHSPSLLTQVSFGDDTIPVASSTVVESTPGSFSQPPGLVRLYASCLAGHDPPVIVQRLFLVPLFYMS